MNWEYTRDNRTDAQVHQNYAMGKKAQKLIIERLKEYTDVRYTDDDVYGQVSTYTPDCEIVYRGEWVPLEIKYTKTKLSQVHWKENQWRHARSHGGYLLQISAGRCALIAPSDKHYMKDSGYCNKQVAVFSPEWYPTFACILI